MLLRGGHQKHRQHQVPGGFGSSFSLVVGRSRPPIRCARSALIPIANKTRCLTQVGACRIPKKVRVNLKALRPIGPFAEHGPILAMIGVRASVALKLLAVGWDPHFKR